MDPATEEPLEPLLAALRPEPERGRSVLVSGGVSRAREALATLAVEALGATGALVVRCGHAPGNSLADTIAAGVEARLAAARAPGGLYDDRGAEVLRSLGSWLFRGRAVGMRGLVLVLDDIDAWTDARGGGGGGGGRDTLALEALLGEVPRRALSVLATARAGTAAGGPALAASLVARFGTARVLGAVPTVQRDPGLFTAELAGRSWSLAGIQRALPGWLSLRADGAAEDTLVVFTTPLGPPALDLPPPEPPGDDPAGPDEGRSDPRRWLQGITAAMQLRALLRRMDEPLTPDARAIESAFRKGAGGVPWALEGVRSGARSVDYRPRVLPAVEGALARFEGEFQVQRRALPTDGPGAPRTLCTLPAVLGAFAAACGARSALFVSCIGLREDLYQALCDRVLSRLRGLCRVDEGFHWAAAVPAELPENTQEPAFSGAAAVFRRGRLGGVEVLQTDLCARALASSGGGLERAVALLDEPLREGLRALKGGSEARAALLLTGDRGDPLGQRLGETVFEVLVPYGLFTWDSPR